MFEQKPLNVPTLCTVGWELFNVSDLSSSLRRQIITEHESLSQIQKLTGLADISYNYKCCFFSVILCCSFIFIFVNISQWSYEKTDCFVPVKRLARKIVSELIYTVRHKKLHLSYSYDKLYSTMIIFGT